MPATRRGFTLVELLVVLLMIVLAVSILLPGIERTRHRGGRLKCPSNLRQIGQAIQMYANDHKGHFPRAVYDGVGGAPTEYTAPLAPHPFLGGGPGPNDVTAALFLLVRTQDLTPEVFVCPSVDGAERWDFGGGGRTAQGVSNFPGRQFLTYSYANPYPTPAAEKAGYKLDYTLTSEFAIVADMNPGGSAVVAATPTSPKAVLASANSPNHAGDGQNVLYADGHVEFQNTPFCGMRRDGGAAGGTFRDNLYTPGAGSGSAAVRGAAADALDSVLLPTALDGPAFSAAASPAAKGSMGWLWGTMAATFAACAIFAAQRTRRGQQRSGPAGGATA